MPKRDPLRNFKPRPNSPARMPPAVMTSPFGGASSSPTSPTSSLGPASLEELLAPPTSSTAPSAGEIHSGAAGAAAPRQAEFALALVGAGTRGLDVGQSFLKVPGVHFAYVVDVDAAARSRV